MADHQVLPVGDCARCGIAWDRRCRMAGSFLFSCAFRRTIHSAGYELWIAGWFTRYRAQPVCRSSNDRRRAALCLGEVDTELQAALLSARRVAWPAFHFSSRLEFPGYTFLVSRTLSSGSSTRDRVALVGIGAREAPGALQ